MPRLLQWDKIGDRLYETGVDRGVLFPMSDGEYEDGVVWNGLTNVAENPTGAEPNPIYADNIKYLNLISNEEFEAGIEAYTYPEEFEECDGSKEIAPGVLAGQQKRKPFGFSYRTKLGNDTDGDAYGYKIHLVYNAQAAPTEKSYETINDTPDAITFSWDITTTPVDTEGLDIRPTAKLTIDSTKVDSGDLAALEAVLYGTAAVVGDNPSEAVAAKLPSIAEVIAIFED